MNQKDSKKLYAFAIFEVLKNHSDETHTLSQKEIIQYMWEDYNIKINRKSIRRNIEDLNEILCLLGKPTILYGSNKDSDSEVRTYFNRVYYPRVMSDSKLTLIISTLMSANNISNADKKTLTDALKELGSIGLKKNNMFIPNYYEGRQFNTNLFENIAIFTEAINLKQKVSLLYLQYNAKKELAPKISKKTGKPAYSTISPYYIVTKAEKLYLICSSFSFEKQKHIVMHYRIDRISDPKILNETRTPMSEVEEMGRHFDLNRYMEEHIDMLTSPTITTTFMIKKWLIGDVMDTFGGCAHIINASDDTYTIKVRTARRPFLRWASKFATDVIIQTPKDLVSAFCKRTQLTERNYEENRLNTPDEPFDY